MKIVKNPLLESTPGLRSVFVTCFRGARAELPKKAAESGHANLCSLLSQFLFPSPLPGARQTVVTKGDKKRQKVPSGQIA
jgi:hypothetical protein